MSDILLMLRDYEPSRAKLWEMVRRYDPLQFAAFLYLLENVRKEPRKKPITLPCDKLYEFADARPWSRDTSMRLHLSVTLRTDRVASEPTHLFAMARYASRLESSRHRSAGDASVYDLLDRIRSPPRDSDATYDEPQRQPYLLIVAHNLSTNMYQRFLNNVVNMLFPDDMQGDRSRLLPDQMVAIRYLRYHRQLSLQRSLCATDSRRFRYVMLPRPRRVYRRPTERDGGTRYVYQSLYQGFHAVMDQEFDSSLSVRVFNRYGELQRNLLPPLRLATSCTFEAVVVPVDRCGWSRSWRYWPYREGCRIYVCDVFRYGDRVLATLPFVERLRYARRLCEENGQQLTLAATSERWSDLMADRVYDERRTTTDMFPPIVGVIARDGQSQFSPFYADQQAAVTGGGRQFELVASAPLQYRFHVRLVYDVLEDRPIRVGNGTSSDGDAVLKTLRTERLFFDLEMADSRYVWLAYGHTDDSYFLCAYNPSVQQYEHTITLERSPYDTELEPKYQQERLVVLNAKTIPRGFLYLRVYLDRDGRYVGYETKLTTSRYDVPCDAHLVVSRVTGSMESVTVAQ